MMRDDRATGKTIAFCETRPQVDRLLSDQAWMGRIGTWLAVTPEAAWCLRQTEIDYRKPEDFYEEAALYSHSRSQAEVADGWACWTDGYLQSAIGEFKQLGFRAARTHFYALKVLLDALFMRAYILDHMLRAVEPAEVVFFGQDAPLPIADDLLFQESVYSLILPIFCRRLEIAVTRLDGGLEEPCNTALSGPAPTRPAGSLLDRIKELLPDGIRARLRLLARYGLDGLPGLWNHRCDGGTIILQPAYDVELLWLQACRAAMACGLLSDLLAAAELAGRDSNSITERLGGIWDRLASEEPFRRPFIYCGLDLFETVEPRLRVWWNRVVPEAWGMFVGTRRLLLADPPKAAVVPIAGGHKERAFLAAARSLDIPVVIYQHGGFVANCDTDVSDFMDLADADSMLLYGQGTADFYKARVACCQEPRAVPIPVGSARLDEVSRQRSKAAARAMRRRLVGRQDRPVVLYVPTIFFGYTRYLCGTYPDVSYFELQHELIRLFREFPRTLFLYKAFVDVLRNPLPDLIQEAAGNCLVVWDLRLTDLIWAVDAIIVDFPSTGLLEALLTDKKIICYADERNSRLTPEAKSLLSRRAVVTERPEEFLLAVRRLLKTGDFSPEPEPDREFLKAYGTHRDDGRSAERALAALEEIVRAHGSRRSCAGTLG